MTVDEQLDQLADTLEPTEFQNGEATIGPDEGQNLESFQADVQRLRRYASEGHLEIRWEHKDSRGSDRYIDRVRIRMGPEGVGWRKEFHS
ncbi:MAG TPA: hypothetical protein VNO50_03145 [Pyrinomonadaceae bacterium]|nr:hypothetical protein [Pyrinomonadaceae bacterium]